VRVSGDLFEIDANVILRYLLQDNTELSPKATAIMEAIEDGELTVSCDPVILAEVIWVLGSVYRSPRDKIAFDLAPIIEARGFLVPNKERYVFALSIYATSNAHFGDACACAAALECSDGRLLSFDRDLSRIPGIHRLEKPTTK